MYMSMKTHILKKIDLSLSYYLPEDFHILRPKRPRAESTHPENWPKRPTYQGRNDPPPKLAETTQDETTQAETTQGRNDPDSPKLPRNTGTTTKYRNYQYDRYNYGWVVGWVDGCCLKCIYLLILRHPHY